MEHDGKSALPRKRSAPSDTGGRAAAARDDARDLTSQQETVQRRHVPGEEEAPIDRGVPSSGNASDAKRRRVISHPVASSAGQQSSVVNDERMDVDSDAGAQPVNRLAACVDAWASRAWSVHAGATSFATALIVIGSSPQALGECLRCAVFPMLCTVFNVVILWCGLWPLRWLRWRSLSWEGTIQMSSLFVLLCCRWLLPLTSNKVFFIVLALRNETLATAIKARRRVGLRKEVWQLVQAMAVGIVLLAFLLVFGAALIPGIAQVLAALKLAMASWQLIATLLSLGWWLPVLLAITGLIWLTVIVLCGWGYQLARPFIVIWRSVDPVLALVAMAVVALRLLHLGTVRSLVKQAAVVCFSCGYLVDQLLVEYKHRLEGSSWKQFKERHKFELLGFGLPIWLVVQNYPLLTVALLPIFHGAAASFLADVVREV